jgi:hypothetical protein
MRDFINRLNCAHSLAVELKQLLTYPANRLISVVNLRSPADGGAESMQTRAPSGARMRWVMMALNYYLKPNALLHTCSASGSAAKRTS